MTIPLTKRGAPLTLGKEDLLAPGVRVYAIKHDGAIYIPFIAADTPGNGDVSRFLDSLPTDVTIRVPCVINRILAAALKRRGFVETQEYAEEVGEWVEIYERLKAAPR